MFSIRVLCASAAVLFASGCASITSDSHQPVSVSTTKDGQLVEKAKCSLRNDKGRWEVETPGVIEVHRSAEDLVVTCKKEDLPDGIARGISRAAGGMFGNIVFGGGIGAVIDHASGKGYNYPNDLQVKMGESTTFDRAKEGKQNTAQPMPATATAPAKPVAPVASAPEKTATAEQVTAAVK